MRKEFTFHTSDGTGLYMVQDVTAPPKAAVIIVHGLCEHLGRYEYLTERLCERNLMVYRFDHRGHGKSEGKRVYYDRFETISDDVNEVAACKKPQRRASSVHHRAQHGRLCGFLFRG